MGVRTAAASLVPLLVLLSACPADSGASHELPADWPIAQLTIDPDWQLRKPASAMHQLDPAQYPDPIWLVVFDKDGDWPGVVSHVEGCLKPLGWLRSKSKGLSNPLGLDLPETRTYYAPDYLTEVYMTNGCYFDVLIDIDGRVRAADQAVQPAAGVDPGRPQPPAARPQANRGPAGRHHGTDQLVAGAPMPQ